MSLYASEASKRDLLIRQISEGVGVSPDNAKKLARALVRFSTKQLNELQDNVKFIMRDLDDPAGALLSTLKEIIAKEPRSSLYQQRMEELFRKYIPEEYTPKSKCRP